MEFFWLISFFCLSLFCVSARRCASWFSFFVKPQQNNGSTPKKKLPFYGAIWCNRKVIIILVPNDAGLSWYRWWASTGIRSLPCYVGGLHRPQNVVCKGFPSCRVCTNNESRCFWVVLYLHVAGKEQICAQLEEETASSTLLLSGLKEASFRKGHHFSTKITAWKRMGSYETKCETR